jgi:arsenate reductase (thioredoxin)
MKKILVLCTGNSCRSQMAEGYLKYFGKGQVKVYSAGIEAHGLNADAVTVMHEDGIDISAQTSNRVDEFKDLDFDFIITVCDHARENCPYFPSIAKKFHQDFPDPAKASGSRAEVLDQFRKVRDLIKAFCEDFITKQL